MSDKLKLILALSLSLTVTIVACDDDKTETETAGTPAGTAAGEAAGEAGALIAPADALRLSSSPCCSRTCWLPISRNSAPDVIGTPR